jgi:hypothetical protein
VGSGSGKQRRVRVQVKPQGAATSPAAAQLFAVDAWRRFVDGSGVGDQNIFDYYLGAGNRPTDKDEPNFSVERYRHLLQEFFWDACSIGAIVLPDGVTPDDVIIGVQSVSFRTWEHTAFVDVMRGGVYCGRKQMRVFLPRCKMSDFVCLERLAGQLSFAVAVAESALVY